MPLVSLNQGKIELSPNILWNSPLIDFFKEGQKELYNEACIKLNREKYSQIDDDMPHSVYFTFLERLLNRIREKGHGGTLIIIPDEIKPNDGRLQDRISIKYPCYYNAFDALVQYLEASSKFYELLFALYEKKEITEKEFTDYERYQSDLKEAREHVRRTASFLSSLSAVDGAVILTDKFKLLGFGAEITATSPSLKHIKVITDFEKSEGEYINIELFGTRHRSAFRLCSSFENSIAAIVSSDGDIRVAKRIGYDLVLWPNVSVVLFPL